MQKLDKEQELFTITMEECGELIQCCSKAMRRWELFKNSDSEISLKEEIGDVYTMISLLVEYNVVTWNEIKDREKIKRKKLEQWSGLIPHPPKTEAPSVELPSEPYKQKMIYAHTNFSSEPMSEQEEKEWQRLEQVLESQKNAKETI
jgi:NTP pyrophosphatase (non-canonical NTP hydrolase)